MPAALDLETGSLTTTEAKANRKTLWSMECVVVLVNELLETYKDDPNVIQSFLVEMTEEEMGMLKLEIDKFQTHLSEVETGLASDRQELEL